MQHPCKVLSTFLSQFTETEVQHLERCLVSKHMNRRGRVIRFSQMKERETFIKNARWLPDAKRPRTLKRQGCVCLNTCSCLSAGF